MRAKPRMRLVTIAKTTVPTQSVNAKKRNNVIPLGSMDYVIERELTKLKSDCNTEDVGPCLPEVFEIANQRDVKASGEARVLLDGVHDMGGLGESDDLIKADAAEDIMDVCIAIEAIDHLLSGGAKAVSGWWLEPADAVGDTAV
jgi:hypothetical protein